MACQNDIIYILLIDNVMLYCKLVVDLLLSVVDINMTSCIVTYVFPETFIYFLVLYAFISFIYV